MARFYCTSFKADSVVQLDSEETHHLARVLRAEEGEKITLIDGKGSVGEGEILSLSNKVCQVKVGSVSFSEKKSQIVLGFGIPKGPALDFIIRRVTEVGLLAFQPVGTEHSFKAKEFNSDRWHRVLPEIAKQCQEPHFPEIREAVTFEKLLSQFSAESIFFCDEEDRDRTPGIQKPDGPVLLLVGAEGGWSPKERAMIREKKAQTLSLGANRLRAETACLVGVSILKKLLGEI